MMVGMNVFFAMLTNALHESKYGDKNSLDDSAVLSQIWVDAKQWFVKKIELEKRMKTYFPVQYKKWKQQQYEQQAKKVRSQPGSASIAQPQTSSSSASSTSSTGYSSYDDMTRPVSSFKAKE